METKMRTIELDLVKVGDRNPSNTRLIYGEGMLQFVHIGETLYDRTGSFPFSMEFDKVQEHKDLMVSEQCFHRPINFQEAINWVNQNIPEDYRQQWFDVFDKMKIDESIYFKFEY